jgi:hypothetical protein
LPACHPSNQIRRWLKHPRSVPARQFLTRAPARCSSTETSPSLCVPGRPNDQLGIVH